MKNILITRNGHGFNKKNWRALYISWWQRFMLAIRRRSPLLKG